MDETATRRKKINPNGTGDWYPGPRMSESPIFIQSYDEKLSKAFFLFNAQNS